jgi:hypothetical protein
MRMAAHADKGSVPIGGSPLERAAGFPQGQVTDHMRHRYSWVVQLDETNPCKPYNETSQSGPERQQDTERSLDDAHEEAPPEHRCAV